MKTEIITINGKQYTRIVKPADCEWIKGRLNIGIAVRVVDTNNISHTLTDLDGANYVDRNAQYIQSIITTLDPLPRYPTAEDAKLLYEYASHGLFAVGNIFGYSEDGDIDVNSSFGGIKFIEGDINEITYCVNKAGESVEVAIV